MYIKTGDTVAIIAGSDQFTVDKKGVKTRRTGRVIKVLKDQDKVIVEGINIAKKHEKPSQANEKGGIIEIPKPIHVSNVALIDPKTGLPTRIQKQVTVKEVKGKNVRVVTRVANSGTPIDKVKK